MTSTLNSIFRSVLPQGSKKSLCWAAVRFAMEPPSTRGEEAAASDDAHYMPGGGCIERHAALRDALRSRLGREGETIGSSIVALRRRGHKHLAERVRQANRTRNSLAHPDLRLVDEVMAANLDRDVFVGAQSVEEVAEIPGAGSGCCEGDSQHGGEAKPLCEAVAHDVGHVVQSAASTSHVDQCRKYEVTWAGGVFLSGHLV